MARPWGRSDFTSQKAETLDAGQGAADLALRGQVGVRHRLGQPSVRHLGPRRGRGTETQFKTCMIGAYVDPVISPDFAFIVDDGSVIM